MARIAATLPLALLAWLAAPARAEPAAPEGAPLTLEQLVQHALAHSPLLDELRAGVALAEAKQLQADWAWLPELQIG